MSSNAFCVSPFAHYRNICNHFVPGRLLLPPRRLRRVRCSAFLAFYKVKPYTALCETCCVRLYFTHYNTMCGAWFRVPLRETEIASSCIQRVQCPERYIRPRNAAHPQPQFVFSFAKVWVTITPRGGRARSTVLVVPVLEHVRSTAGTMYGVPVDVCVFSCSSPPTQ